MQYQSFFMLLKSFSIIDNKFCLNEPLSAKGFVQLKKEQEDYYIIVQISNFTDDCVGYVICENDIQEIQIDSATIKEKLNFNLNEHKFCFLLPKYNYFAVKNSTEDCMKYYSKITNYLKNKSNDDFRDNMFEKIFNKPVYNTYFFDCIKPKIANLFSLGSPCSELNEKYTNSKWVSINAKDGIKVVGVVYKNDFAYAIGMGTLTNDMSYDIMFLSASNGKIINVQ